MDDATQTKLRWSVIALCLVITIISAFPLTGLIDDIMPLASAMSFFVAACLHGIKRYGAKNTFVFFMITWIVSLLFEALSIQTGFPFGHYHYAKLIGPRILDVPLVIMFAYFGMGYLSWILSTVITDLYTEKLRGANIFFIPLIATFIMVLWDLVMDPSSSTIGLLWIWRDGGPYYGVPLQNYFGWFFVVYIIMQLFSFYISRFDLTRRTKILSSKEFWYEACVLYGIQGMVQLLYPFLQPDHPEIFGSMALVTIFTMMFVTLISFVAIKNTSSLK